MAQSSNWGSATRSSYNCIESCAGEALCMSMYSCSCSCVCVCVCVCVYMLQLYSIMYVYTYIHTCTEGETVTYTCTRIQMRTCMWFVQFSQLICVDFIHTYTHIFKTDVYIYIYIYIYTHTHIHTCAKYMQGISSCAHAHCFSFTLQWLPFIDVVQQV
jgi:hypothetical protein